MKNDLEVPLIAPWVVQRFEKRVCGSIWERYVVVGSRGEWEIYNNRIFNPNDWL